MTHPTAKSSPGTLTFGAFRPEVPTGIRCFRRCGKATVDIPSKHTAFVAVSVSWKPGGCQMRTEVGDGLNLQSPKIRQKNVRAAWANSVPPRADRGSKKVSAFNQLPAVGETILIDFRLACVSGVLPAGYLFCCKMYARIARYSAGFRLPGASNGMLLVIIV
jgi:hypothetical protein